MYEEKDRVIHSLTHELDLHRQMALELSVCCLMLNGLIAID